MQLLEAIPNRAKTFASTIKKDCKFYLNEIDRDCKLYKGLGSTEDFFKTKYINEDKHGSPELFYGLNQIFDISKIDMVYENALTVDARSNVGHGNPYIIFPIGSFDYAWNSGIRNPYVDFELTRRYWYIDEASEQDIKKEAFKLSEEDIKDEIEEDIQNALSAYWMDYMAQKAREHYNNLPDTDPDHYVTEDHINNVAIAWLDHYKTEFENAVEQKVKETMLQEHTVDKIITLAEEYVEQLSKSKKYGLFNTEEFVNNESKNYIINENLDIGIKTDSQIIMNCDSYYAIDPTVYDLFVEELLWR